MPSMTESTTAQKIAAEVIGTFVLVLFGCGSVVFANNAIGGGDFTAVGLTFGLAVLIGAYAFGRISGAHFNPAVTVGAAAGGRLSWRQVPLYMAAQLGGAVLAGLVLFVLLQGFDGFDATNNMGQNFFGDNSPAGQTSFAWWAALLVELLLTFLFVTVILAVTDTRNEHPALAPLVIGLTLSAIHFVAIPLTGTSVNPARSIGPALFAGGDAILQLWLFILAPLAGGVVAGVVYPLLFDFDAEPVPGSGLRLGRRGPTGRAGRSTYGGSDAFQREWNQGGATEQSAWAQEPIIQDGWQWDHAAQEWRPLEQSQPAQPAQVTAQPVATDPAVSPGEQPAPGPAHPSSDPG